MFNQRGSFIPVLAVFILLIITSIGIYYLRTQKEKPFRQSQRDMATKSGVTIDPPNPGYFPQSLEFKPFPVSPPPETWMTYENPELKIALKYPTEKWERKTVMGFDTLWIKGDKSVWVNIQNAPGILFNEATKQYIESSKSRGDSSAYNKILLQEYITLGNKKGFLYELEEVPNEKFYIEIMLFDEKGMANELISFYAFGRDNFDKYKPEFNQILATYTITQ